MQKPKKLKPKAPVQFIREPVVKPQDKFWEHALTKLDKKRTWITRGALVVAALAIAAGGIFYYQYRELRDRPPISAETSVQEENSRLLASLAQFIVLPANEEPSIATVTDPEKLRGQAFFANAKLGDKVVIYTKAKKAILYRPSENKVIDVAPLNL